LIEVEENEGRKRRKKNGGQKEEEILVCGSLGVLKHDALCLHAHLL
jgi:hypothetical protein